MPDILNLGAGTKPMRKGVINHDRIRHGPHIDVVHDLNVLPWPWEDNSFDHIVARSVMEHLNIDLVQALDECWRILRPGGRAYLKVPFYAADASYSDPTHRWRYNLQSFDVFVPETKLGTQYVFYTERKWQFIKGPRLNTSKTSIHILLEVRKP